METCNDLSMRHLREWENFRRDILNPLYVACRDCDSKEAKTVADVTKIVQEGERKAYGFRSGADDSDVEIEFNN